MREIPQRGRRSRKNQRLGPLFAAHGRGAILLFSVLPLLAQDAPKFTIDDDCQAFDIAPDNSIVYAVTHIKGVKRLVIERDEISIATGPGKIKHIVDPDKFMPIPPPAGYTVNSLAWSPDGQKIAVDMTLQQAAARMGGGTSQQEKRQHRQS